MTKQRLSIILLSLSLLVVISEKKVHLIARLYDDWILDNKNHYVPCDKLPDKKMVERVMKEQQAKIKEIENIAPDRIFISMGDGGRNCENKADIVIYYGSHNQRKQIKKIIGGNTFFGIPYRLKTV